LCEFVGELIPTFHRTHQRAGRRHRRPGGAASTEQGGIAPRGRIPNPWEDPRLAPPP
jgi:hypothetical protein